MKRIQQLTLLLVMLFVAVSCQGDEKPGTTTTTTATTPANTTTTATSPTHVKASDIAPFIGLWAYTKPVARDVARQNYYTGRWIEFAGDGTFKYGKYADQTNTGTFGYDSSGKILSLSFTNTKDTNIDWKIIQGADVMIWMGNAGLNQTGDQIQLKLAKERPSKPAGQ